MTNNPTVALQLVVRNEEKKIRFILDSIKQQTYTNIELFILDNASTDRTRGIIEEYKLLLPFRLSLFARMDNIGPWAGFEELLKTNNHPYTILVTDVIIKEDFVERAIEVMEHDQKIGAVQAKVYQMDWKDSTEPVKTNIFDTTGFQIFRSRRIINRGQGEEDIGQLDHTEAIFGVEGVVPVFRRSALEDCRIEGHVVDPDFRVGPLGYGDDFDIAWRMHLFGFKQTYAPDVVAWHDRSTTKQLSKKWIIDHIRRVRQRQAIPLIKRRIDWSNGWFTIVKNDYIINVLRDLPYILWRCINVLGYTLLFELSMFKEVGRFVHLLPTMLGRRKNGMRRAKTSPSEIRKWMS